LITLTERDIKALRFVGNWRFATLEQLQKSGIFTVTRKRAYNRLLQLCRDGYLQATVLGRGQIYYRLTVKGGEAAGFLDRYWSRRYQDAGREVALKALTALDFALATGVQYIFPQRSVRCTAVSCLRRPKILPQRRPAVLPAG
jgi:hypothetical protein